MQTVDHRTSEEHQFRSSFILPDIFEDDENEVEIRDGTIEPTRWRISTLMANVVLALRKYSKSKIRPIIKRVSNISNLFTSFTRSR